MSKTYKGYKTGDIFIWRVRNKVNNPLQVGYLHYDKEHEEWYIGDENNYPSPSGYDPDYVIKYGIKVATLEDIAPGHERNT